ncbi:hypothetical protein GOBAR_AA05560 [Gossypium barbadense]|uniref:Squalene monooxygenase n=1 Tax=Gossypium barbadense TaxID=3634 RepID=A0A2P5YHD2_GOSBA|nr:hypothetical protein GOBAR_AA05560 [Gossypium barbadense]
MISLGSLLVTDCVEEIDAQRVLGYAVFKDGRNTKLSYTQEKFHADVAGRSFHNGRFIWRMREKAATLPKLMNYELAIDLLSPSYVDMPSCFMGLVLENCKLSFPNHGHVILADPSPILFYPISSTEVHCLVYVPGKKVPVAPQVPPELCEAFIAAVDKGNIRTMPNRSMPADPHQIPGALLMGNAFNMRHPLTGGGMTVALSDIAVLRDLLRPLHDLHDADSLAKYCESFYTLRKIYYGPPKNISRPPQARGFYNKYAGRCSLQGPVALLSGLNPCPLSLVLHFFAVGSYGIGRLLLPFPSLGRMLIGARLISSASGIIFPIIKAGGVRQMFFLATVPAVYRTPPVD